MEQACRDSEQYVPICLVEDFILALIQLGYSMKRTKFHNNLLWIFSLKKKKYSDRSED